MKINELTIFPLVKCCHSLSQFERKLFAPFFRLCHKSYTFVTYRRMIVIIIYFHKLLVISILYSIVWLYDNKDKQDKKNISYWE